MPLSDLHRSFCDRRNAENLWVHSHASHSGGEDTNQTIMNFIHRNSVRHSVRRQRAVDLLGQRHAGNQLNGDVRGVLVLDGSHDHNRTIHDGQGRERLAVVAADLNIIRGEA
jgi:hypothetical protein